MTAQPSRAAAGESVRLVVAYDGTAYAGWQRQPNAVAVQQRLEEALERLLGAPARTVGAGRTDAGVHAEGQVVSSALPRPFAISGLVAGLNHHLPPDIRVRAATPAPLGYDARRAAVAKRYRYRLLPGGPPSPALARYVVAVEGALDRGRLEAATRPLVGRHDFSAFALAGGAARTSVRRIFAARWQREGDELVLRLCGDGFLRGMVRGLVGTLLEVASGRRSLDELVRLLGGGARSAAGPTAPARGLCLEAVDEAPAHGAGAPAALW